MFFADIHVHILFGCDDGPSSRDEMYKMVDLAYNDGIRYMCVTPHFCPTEFGNNAQKSQKVFNELTEYCSEKYPDLRIFFGNELFYMDEGVSWLKQGMCKTMGASRYVLVEFNCTESESRISEGIYSLIRLGYVPIIAHAERYTKLSMKCLKELAGDGVLLQINSQSVFRGFGFLQKMRVNSLLSEGLVHFVSSDGHSSVDRKPLMSGAYKYLSEKYGEEYANRLCFENAIELIFNNIVEENDGKR